MSKFVQILIIGLAAVVAATAARADDEDDDDDDCKFTAQRSQALDTQGASRVEISARAGDLVIEGAKGSSRVEAGGKACASSQAYLDEIQLVSRRDGDVLFLDVRMPDTDKIVIGWSSNYARLDLRVTVPDSLAVRATDSSGAAQVRGLASLDMTDSSGELRISDIPGDVDVRDSSGKLRIGNVGSVRLSDSSGEVDIDGVERNVHVEVDSSGALEIKRVKGAVQIDQDSSGEIVITDIGGNVRIDSDSSGDVTVKRVGGTFDLGSKGSGDVQVAEVKGAVNVPR